MDDDCKKFKLRQEITYLAYTREILKYNIGESFEEWKKIKNGVAQLFDGDGEQQLIEFSHLYDKSFKPLYCNENLRRSLKPIKIYKSEVDFLNGLDVPVWVKEYWFCLLFYYKFESQNKARVQLSTTLNNWCIRHCVSIKAKYYHNSQDKIAEYKMKIKKEVIKYSIKQKDEKYNAYTPMFLAGSGKVAKEYDDISDIKKALKLIKPNYAICPKCGKKHIVSSKSKTDLCPNCYTLYRKEKIKENAKRYKKQKKLESIEQIQ